MDARSKRRAIVGTLFSILVVMSFAFFNYFSVSTELALTYLAKMPTGFISTTVDFNVLSALTQVLIDFIKFFIPFVPLVLAFSVLVVYGVKFGEDKKLGLVAGIIASLIGVLLVGFSFTSLLFATGIVACSVFLTDISQIYFSELKKWRNYRVGSLTVSKCLLVINILLCFGVFFMSISNLDHYTDIYKQETKNMITEMLPEFAEEEALKEAQKIEGFEDLPPDKQKEFLEQYKEQLTKQEGEIEIKIDEMINSENITAFFYLSIFLMVLVVFGVLDFLRTIIFCPIAGAVTKLAFRGLEKPQNESF